jgi:hypothetical protein
VVDKHIKEIEKTVFPTLQEGEKFMDDFLKEVLVKINSKISNNVV